MSKTIRISIIIIVAIAVAAVFAYKSYKQEAAAGVQTAAIQNDFPVAPAALPLLLDLGSHTCIPCKMMMPILEELKNGYSGKFNVEFVDVMQNQTAADKYSIEAIPTQIFFDASGKEVFRHVGFFPKEEILKKWRELGVTVQDESNK
jgi:thioredoxin 1